MWSNTNSEISPEVRCNFSQLLVRKITKRIHSSKPASLNRPLEHKSFCKTKLNALAHIIHAHIYTWTYIYIYTKSVITGWKSWAGFWTVGIFHKLIPDRAMKLNKCSPKDYVLEFSNASQLGIGGCMKFGVCRMKLKDKRGVCCWIGGMQRLLSCTHIRILQAASAVHLTVVWLKKFQNKLCCSVLNPLHLTYPFHR